MPAQRTKGMLNIPYPQKPPGGGSIKSSSMDCKQNSHKYCIWNRCDCLCHQNKVYHWGRWKSIETRRRHESGVQEPEVWFVRDGKMLTRMSHVIRHGAKKSATD